MRPFTEADKRPYAQINADPEVMRYFPALATQAESNAHIKRINNGWDNGAFHLLAAELKLTGKFIGFIGLAPIPEHISSIISGHPRAEVGWRLHQSVWGQGLAPEGARACLIYAWNTLKLNEVVSFTSALNTPSQRVMQKIGMTRKASDNFEHPKLPAGHKLRPHVLYRINNPN